MENPEVAQVFEEVADLLAIQGANPFRVRAYRTASRTIRDLSQSLSQMIAGDGKQLASLPGIGKDLAGKITTIVQTGDLPLRRELYAKVPRSLRELLNVPGLGPKRALILHDRLGINSLAQLRRAAERHQLRKLKGFGEKSEQKILAGLGQAAEAGRRFYLDEAKVYAESMVRHLKNVPGLHEVAVAGSYRRRKETVGDLDVLVACNRAGAVMDRLAEYDAVAEVTARGPTKMTVRLKTGMQVDLRVVRQQSYGAALQYFTGSKQHNILVRRRGQEMGLKLNEYGVFRGRRRVAGRTEEDIYAAVKLPWIPPELREGGHELELASAGQLPTLLERADIRGDLHMHTTATDGRASLEDMVEAAKGMGYAYIAITDHSKRVTMAKGLDARRLRQHWKQIDQLAERTKGIMLLKGVELDILEDGTLDLPDRVLRDADWVVAAIHYGQNQSREKITQRLLNAIRNPYVHAIGHPTGRIIGKRKAYDVDLDTVFQAAADYGCFLELNCQPARLDLSDVHVAAARDHGIPIVLGTDAHATEELGFMELGVWQARRAGLTKADVVNTNTWSEFRKLLHHKRRSPVAI